MMKLQRLLAVTACCVGIVMMVMGMQSGEPDAGNLGLGGILLIVGFVWFVVLRVIG